MLVRTIIRIVLAKCNRRNNARLACVKYEVGSVGTQILHRVSLQMYFFELELEGIHSRI